MNLTIDEIKEKNKQLNLDIKKLLDKHKAETELIVLGEINHGYTKEKNQHYLTLKFNNPF